MPRKRKSEINVEEQKRLDMDIAKDLVQANAIIARTLIRRGGTIEEVAETTGLSIEHVAHLQKSYSTRKNRV